MIPIEFYLMFAAILFVIGLYGIMTTDKAIISLMCIELMLNAANINFIAFASYGTFAATSNTMGQVFVLFTIAIAAAEVGVGIALVLNAYKMKGTTNVDELTSMRW
jgi:NADH:ubiquinone oxidoreductase subunit K